MEEQDNLVEPRRSSTHDQLFASLPHTRNSFPASASTSIRRLRVALRHRHIDTPPASARLAVTLPAL